MAVIGAPTPHPVLACTCDDSGARRWRSPVSEVWTTAPSAPLHAGGETAGEAVPVTSSSSVVAALRATRGGERPDQKRNLVRARADDWQAPGVDDISFTLDGDPPAPRVRRLAAGAPLLLAAAHGFQRWQQEAKAEPRAARGWWPRLAAGEAPSDERACPESRVRVRRWMRGTCSLEAPVSRRRGARRPASCRRGFVHDHTKRGGEQ
uniref:Uncharacterized protein n=1 Tax=Setaria viridis TaxID=4556 RepID=A0A4U6TI32_SETVI|nr:LOW QUALITY PROTEIN: hypothetical protein SEVIR_8G218520v2 [Setaria viridis]